MKELLILVSGLLGAGVYYTYAPSNLDPRVFEMSVDEAREKIASKVLNLPRYDKDGTIELKGIGGKGDYAKMTMQNHETAPIIPCTARIEALNETEVKVSADCSDGSSSASAMNNTMVEYNVAWFDEFIQSTLDDRDFNRSTVSAKGSAITMKNMGGMQKEALRMADEMQALEAENR